MSQTENRDRTPEPCGDVPPTKSTTAGSLDVPPVEAWQCKSCFRSVGTEAVEIRQADRSWADSTVRRCVSCKSTFGGTVEDRLAYVRDTYDYKYFGDYEMSPEQMDAVHEAVQIATLVPDLLAELKWCMIGAGNRTRMAAAIAKAEGKS